MRCTASLDFLAPKRQGKLNPKCSVPCSQPCPKCNLAAEFLPMELKQLGLPRRLSPCNTPDSVGYIGASLPWLRLARLRGRRLSPPQPEAPRRCAALPESPGPTKRVPVAPLSSCVAVGAVASADRGTTDASPKGASACLRASSFAPKDCPPVGGGPVCGRVLTDTRVPSGPL